MEKKTINRAKDTVATKPNSMPTFRSPCISAIKAAPAAISASGISSSGALESEKSSFGIPI